MNAEKSKPAKNRLRGVLSVLLFYLCSLIILMFASRLTKSWPKQVADLTSVGFAALLTCGLVVLFTRWSKYQLRDVGVVPGRSTAQRFISGFIIGLSMAALQAGVLLCIDPHFKLILSPDFPFTKILPPLILYFLVACREELVFRSYALRTLDNNFSSAIAIVIMVGLFILEHIIGGVPLKMAILGSGLGGVLFSITALKTKGLALPLGLHFSWNFGQWAVGFKDSPGIFRAVVDNGHEASTETLSLTIYTMIMLSAITGTLLAYRKRT